MTNRWPMASVRLGRYLPYSWCHLALHVAMVKDPSLAWVKDESSGKQIESVNRRAAGNPTDGPRARSQFWHELSSRGDPSEDLKIASHVKTVEHLATFPPLDCDLAAGFVKLIAKERALAQQRLDAGHYLPGSLLALISKELGN